MSAHKPRRISTLGSRFTSLASVTLVLILLGIAAMCLITTARLGDEVRANVGFVIKMEPGCGASVYDALKRNLLADKDIATVTYTSAEDILRQESEALGEDVLALLDSNPYRAEFDVKVKPAAADPIIVDGLVSKYSDAPGVEEIVTQTDVIEGLSATLHRLTIGALIAAGVLLIICVALLHNTVSLSIYSRRFIIHTMKLVGAKSGFIRRPFLKAAAGGGLLAGLCAAAILILLCFYISSLDAAFFTVVPMEYMVCVCAGLTILGIVLCTITAAAATNRYLRADYDDMFLK